MAFHPPRAIVAVTNDLATDNRVDRTCRVLQELGYEVELVGRSSGPGPALDRPYASRRFRLWFRTGALFYGVYNLRLFLHLLVYRSHLIVANDLDTLLACYCAAKLKGSTLVYDTHEFFTEVPELVHRPRIRAVWLAIERWIFPKLRTVITVNDSIAHAYMQRYPIRVCGTVHVVRNIPMPRELGSLRSRRDLGIGENAFVLVLQGSGINVDRGGEEAVLAMKQLPGCFLLIIGGGDAWPTLQRMIAENALEDRVRLIDRLPYVEMMQYTRNADLGLSLDKDTNLNYRFSLPNKLFDYMRAGIPVLVTDLPEVAAIVRRYDAGMVIHRTDPAVIAAAVEELRRDFQRLVTLRQNVTFAAASQDGRQEQQALKALLEALG